MGRPLSKKYFGNRNIGTGGLQTGVLANSQNYSDDRIGGEGVASYGSIAAGTGWTTAPTVTFGTPNIPGGVSVAGTVRYKALSFAATANGTGYNVGDILEVNTGTQTTKARATVSAITSVGTAGDGGTPTIGDDGTNYDSGDLVTFTHANLSQPFKVRVTTAVGGNATVITVEQEAVWTGTGAAPTSTTGWTATTSEGTIDNNGSGLIVNFTTANWGVYSIGTVTVPGSYTVFPSAAGQLDSISPATGTGATATITMGLLSVTVTEKGSGYTDVADAQVTFSGGTGAAATAVLTTDSGAPGSATNQENAIVIRAKIDSEATVRVGDIIKQQASRRYKVKTADGIAVCKLVATDTLALRQAYIQATDDNGNTYFVTKLTAHKALLTQWNNNEADWVYESGQAAPWTFDSTANGRVIIENA